MGPGRGRARGEGDWAGGAAAWAPGGWQHAWARRGLPSPSPSRPQESGSPTAERRGKVGGGSWRKRRGRPSLLPCSPLGVGRAGWPGEGKRVGGGGGERGEPLRGVASEQLPPPPQPAPPFRFTQTNKMAAVTPRLFLPPKSSVQIGRMFTVKMVPVRLRSQPKPPRRSGAGAMTISFSLEPALCLWSPQLSKRKEIFPVMKEIEEDTQKMEIYSMFMDWKNQYC
ncbi:uncharacterized protein LOC129042128 [Pongo pygmaeus]|uniref:uncharacterized protein LOC129042128 n=1 Tax=Pongo pygmaeus TaxID=9600 RepID=UPI0023E2EF89|nr:uncharacterized protein LOC129042128 [Pongo pygmaeus]